MSKRRKSAQSLRLTVAEVMGKFDLGGDLKQNFGVAAIQQEPRPRGFGAPRLASQSYYPVCVYSVGFDRHLAPGQS